MNAVDFYYDYGSPASYLAWTQLPAICGRYGAVLHYRPVVLGAVFKATGNASPAAVPAKSRYVLHDLARWARKLAVAFQPNPHFPIDTILLMKIACGVQLRMPQRFEAVNRALFEALWVEALNLGDPARVSEVLRKAGFDPAMLLGLADDPEVRAGLRHNTTESVARGAFGAPTFFVGDEMFWGQDRLPMLEEALAAPTRPPEIIAGAAPQAR